MSNGEWLYDSFRRLEDKVDQLTWLVGELQTSKEQLAWLVAEVKDRRENRFKSWQLTAGFFGVMVSLGLGVVGILTR